MSDREAIYAQFRALEFNYTPAATARRRELHRELERIWAAEDRERRTPKATPPPPARAARCCEVCGRAIAGYANRRTCSPKCRRALARGGGLGMFSASRFAEPDQRNVSHLREPDPTIGPSRSVTPLPYEQRGFEAENRGVGDFREVAAGESAQLDLFAEAPAS
jgi:hypothetical protein